VLGDMIFIYHTVFVIIIQLIQCIIYDVLLPLIQKGKNKLSPKTVIIISSVTLVIVLETILTVCDVVQWYTYWNPLTVVGYGKLVMTFVKCTPEVYWNYQRKSTKGWSILGIFLDLIGGTFSFASGEISVENGLNLIKVILGFISVIYDLIFCFQHYVLYR
jgi:cystinosin